MMDSRPKGPRVDPCRLMVGVREYAEGGSPEFGQRGDGRKVIRAYNEGGHACTEVDLEDLLEWLGTNYKPQFGQWQPISEAKRDGTEYILAKYGWLNDASGFEVGSEEWNKAIWDNSRRRFCLWWLCKGFWSDRWQNWNDGIEPSGLADPTHFMPLPPPPGDET